MLPFSYCWLLDRPFQVAIDSATPVDDAAGPSSGNFMMDNAEPYRGYSGGPMRAYGRMYGSLDYDDVSYRGHNFHFDICDIVWSVFILI